MEDRPISLDVKAMQADIASWTQRNFGDEDAYIALLGAVEELGELAGVYIKIQQEIRRDTHSLIEMQDAIGDTIVFLASFCDRVGLDLEEIIIKVWFGDGTNSFPGVRNRDWKKFPFDGRTR